MDTFEEFLALPPPTDVQAQGHLQEARNLAAANLVHLARVLGYRTRDPNVPSKLIMEAAEFNFKLSGLAAKQAAAAPGQGVRVSFNFNAAKPTGAIVEVTNEPDALENPPQYLGLIPEDDGLLIDAEPA